MADALLGFLLENLNSLLKSEVRLICGARKEMDKLSSTLSAIKAVLQDAENKQFENESIRNWLGKLNDLAFQIDDLLDECLIEVSKLQKNNKIVRCLKKAPYYHKIGTRVKEMVEKLNAVDAERQNFHLRESETESQTVFAATRAVRETFSAPNELVFGRDEEKAKIVDILVNCVKDYRQLSILPIIGLGGLGKTTLAQLVYNDHQITEHFDLKLWVCVSDGFEPKALIKTMLKSAKEGGSASDSMPLDALHQRLRELLSEKRYLLIMDDVWNENQEKWAALRKVLVYGSRGASIIVTTRLPNVANIMGTLPAHRLEGLSEKDCWLLFKQRAFGQEEEGEHPNLASIGKQIVKKCAGVPLAATTLGGLLRFKRNEEAWIRIRESELWKLKQDGTSIMPSLRLSYHHLPLELRQCFAYCALFPKDTEIDKEELIHMWMAHGCISSNGTQMEDVGDEVWNELVMRSLFQEVSITDKGKTTCKMHDLVHDLALSIMENQVPGAHTKNSPTQSYNKIRQVHVSSWSGTLPTSIQLQVSTFTSLVKFSHARMLEANWVEALPSSIGKLKQLRSLDLSCSSIQTLPNAICGLQKLLILNLNSCDKLVRLPKNMRYMDTLRHLFLEECDSLIEMPSKMGHLTSLKTLSLFIVGDKIVNQLGELEHLDLGGKLEIKHLEKVKDQKDAKKANLREKSNLRELFLKWEGDDVSASREIMDETVLEALEPHPNIESLKIFGFKGKVFPLWMGNSTMINVVEIEIDNCSNCLHLTPLGDLPRLKVLELEKFDMIEFLTEDEVEGGKSFPSLEKLDLKCLRNLKGFSKKEGREMSPNLRSLKISECSSLRLPPVLPPLKELEVSKCSNWTLSSISKLDNLTSLEVEFDEKMTCIPKEALENLSNLEELLIRNSDEHSLPAEALHGLKSLTNMRVIRMREGVRCLPEEWFRSLTTLEDLSIVYCYDLIELPEGLQHLHSLKRLYLIYLPKLGCLPEGLQHLHSLERLNIWYCSEELKRRCEEGTGEDWHIIAHIPKLHIF